MVTEKVRAAVRHHVLIEDRLVPYRTDEPPRARHQVPDQDWNNAIVLTPQAIEGLQALCIETQRKGLRVPKPSESPLRPETQLSPRP